MILFTSGSAWNRCFFLSLVKMLSCWEASRHVLPLCPPPNVFLFKGLPDFKYNVLGAFLVAVFFSFWIYLIAHFLHFALVGREVIPIRHERLQAIATGKSSKGQTNKSLFFLDWNRQAFPRDSREISVTEQCKVDLQSHIYMGWFENAEYIIPL